MTAAAEQSFCDVLSVAPDWTPDVSVFSGNEVIAFETARGQCAPVTAVDSSGESGGAWYKNPIVLLAGAAGVAVTGSILQADDPGAAAAALRNALDRGRS